MNKKLLLEAQDCLIRAHYLLSQITEANDQDAILITLPQFMPDQARVYTAEFLAMQVKNAVIHTVEATND